MQAYDRIRRTRSQMIWDRSLALGKAFDGWGPHGCNVLGMAKDLYMKWDPVWNHEVTADFNDAVAYLRETKVF